DLLDGKPARVHPDHVGSGRASGRKGAGRRLHYPAVLILREGVDAQVEWPRQFDYPPWRRAGGEPGFRQWGCKAEVTRRNESQLHADRVGQDRHTGKHAGAKHLLEAPFEWFAFSVFREGAELPMKAQHRGAVRLAVLLQPVGEDEPGGFVI